MNIASRLAASVRKVGLVSFAVLLCADVFATPNITNPDTNNVNENTSNALSITVVDPAHAIQSLYISGGVDAADFTLTGITGLPGNAVSATLTFVGAPDFESPSDTGADNVYDVQITAVDSILQDKSQDIEITVLPVNDNFPVITSGAIANSSENVAPGATIYATTQTDADLPGDSFSYLIAAIGDFDDFKIGPTGRLSFLVSPDAESPTDGNLDNVYNIVIRVNDGVNTTNQPVTITVTDVDEFDPTATADSYPGLLAEGAGISVPVGTGVLANDSDADANPSLTATILAGPSNASSFTLYPNGSFDYTHDDSENFTDNFTYTLSDGTGATDTAAVSITITEVNDNVPVITTTSFTNIDEEQTAVGTVIATDVDTTDTQTFTIPGGVGADDAKFSISAGGIMSFIAAPDFDIAGDANSDNTYEVSVRVEDGISQADTQLITVGLVNVNENPVITSDGGGATAALNAAENQTAVTTVTATDVDAADTQTYSLTGGADQSKFTIGGASGILTFAAAPDFEAPDDSNTDGDYVVEVTVTDSGLLTDVQTITVTLTNQNETPVITSDGGGATAALNAVENQTAVTTVTASDVDAADTQTYSLTGGTDLGKFNIGGASGILTFAATPNFEAPDDSNTDGDYVVEVTVTDGGLLTDVQTITVTLTNQNENPVITSDGGGATAALNAAENQTAVTTVTATDVDAADTQTYSLTGGADQSKFTIGGASGILTFDAAPDFEAPDDSNTDGDYVVEVTVTDSGLLTDVQTITVTLTNQNETPVITSDGGGATAAVNAVENQTAVTTVTASDVDAADTQTYSLTGGTDLGKFNIGGASGILTFAATPNFEAPDDSNTDGDYVVEVTVTDGGLLTDVQTITVTLTNQNENPIITSDGGGATAALNAAENQTAVTTVTATDVDAADTQTYSLTGGADQGKFTIGGASGLLTFATAPNFETPDDNDTDGDYVVEVTVTDGGSLTDVQTITVTLSNVNEAPQLTVPGTQTINEDTQTAIGGISVSDIDAVSLTVRIQASTGAVNVTLSGAAAISSGSNDSNDLTVSGIVSDVSATLNTVMFTGDNQDYGTAASVLTITANDAGSSGSGGPLTDVENIQIDITAVNDTPTISDIANQITAEDTSISGIAFTVDEDNQGDLANEDDQVLVITVTSSDQALVPDANITLNFSDDGTDATSGTIDILPDTNQNGAVTITVTVDDQQGVNNTVIDTFLLTVSAVNDAPVITSISGQEVSPPPDFYVAENSVDISTIAATDVEGDSLYFRVTGTDTGGQNSADTGHSTWYFTITGSGDLSFTEEDTLQYGAPDFEAPDRGEGSITDNTNTYHLTVTVYDRDPDVPDPDMLSADTGVLEIQVTDINDAPGQWICETFTAGVSNDTVDARFKYVNGDPMEAVILDFVEDDPVTPAREDCHRLVDQSATSYNITEGDILNGYAADDKFAAIPADTDDINYEKSLLYTVATGLDQDIADVDTDGTLYFSGITLISQYGATVAMTDVDGDRPGPVIQKGGFLYTPPGNLDTEDPGVPPDYFLYRVCDDPSATDEESNCAVGLVEIDIDDVPPVAVNSEAAVTFNEDLSRSPLELPVPAIPNVMVLFDDTADGMQTDLLTNDTVDIGQDGSEGKYIYNNDIKTWIMPYKLGNNNDYAPDEASDPGNGLWRLRTSNYNKLYYDPAVTYSPWSGLDENSLEYTAVDPTNAPDNPFSTGRYYDLTATHSLGGGGGGGGKGGGGSGGGGGGININYYWTWIDSDTDSYVDIGEQGVKVDIISGNAPFAGGTTRTDCVAHADAPNSCTYAEEMQNFANWYSYYRSRGLASKGGLGQVITDSEDLRVGFAEFNGQSNVIGVDELNESELTGHKADVLEKLYSAGDSSGNNNMRTALQRTGNYFACEGQAIVNEAQNKNPGEPGCPVLAAPVGNCQHNFALVISAGFWGGTTPGLEADSDNDTEFDGGRYADTTDDSLADVAMYFYENDLHPDLDDEVPTSLRDLNGVLEDNYGPAFAGADGSTDTMHQHMKTYVIGFGAQGDVSFDDAEALAVDYDTSATDFWGEPTMSDNDKLNDLVHAALNGRGAYLDAGNPTELNTALTAAFEEFSTFIGTATAVSSNAEEILVGSLIYRASYNVSDGTGELVAQQVSVDADGLIVLGSEQWSAAGQLDTKTYDTRTIFTWDPFNFEGVPFRYDNLNTTQREALADSLSAGDPGFEDEVTRHIAYFRGDDTNERPDGNLRERPTVKGRLGDIVNSTPTFYGEPNRARRAGLQFPQNAGYTYAEFASANSARQSMVYLAANDGMFHAFNADSGDEEWAFVPNSVIQGAYNYRIKSLLNYNYLHEYINDLTPSVDDVFIDATGLESAILRNWRTIAIGGLGAGGKGYYALDITDPVPGSGLLETNTTTINNMVLWEFTDEDDTYPTCERPAVDSCTQDQALVDGSNAQLIDTSLTPSEPYRDLGFALSEPTVAMGNLRHSDGEHEWIAVFGNGYNSSSGRAKLYVLRLERGIDGDWCHPDQVYDGNEAAGDPWDYQQEGGLTACPGGADFVKIEVAGPISSPFDGNNDGDYLDPEDDPDRVLANGLGTPRGIDIDRDGTLDYVYAGDRFGNLYRFDLTSDDIADWTGEVMFQASYTESGTDTNDNGLTNDTYYQPITTQPLAVVHPTASNGADCNPDPDPSAFNPCGGFIIIFATGSYVYDDDATDLKISSIYGVWERFQSGAANLITKSDLVEQAYTFNDASELTRTLSSNTVDYSLQADGSSSDKGYYIDLDTPGFTDPSSIPFAGEKAIRNIQGFAGLIFVSSVIPRESGSCTNEAGGAQNAFCPGTGGLDCTGGAVIFDLNGDGLFNSDDMASDGTIPASITIEDGRPTDSTFIGRSRITQLSDQTFQSTMVNPATSDSTGRLSWKHLDSTE